MSPEEKHVLVERLKSISLTLQTRVNYMEADIIEDFESATIHQLSNLVAGMKVRIRELDIIINEIDETIRGIS